MKSMQIPRLGGEWTLYIHDSEEIPAGAIAYSTQYTVYPNRLVGFVKRLGRTNSGADTWHVIPFTSAFDGKREYALYVS